MRVGECMTRDVRTIRPDQTIEDAAIIMREIDVGVVPVADDERLHGMITDRDIVVRALARGMDPNALVRDAMSPVVKYCYADEEAEDVLDNMGDIQVRRLAVVDRRKRLVGIVSLSDLTRAARAGRAGRALGQISRPDGPPA